jgi:hypothetical protein
MDLTYKKYNFRSLSPNVSGMLSNATNNSGAKINDSSSPAKHLSSPTPLAFTPTSVLRKMTAEKEAETSAGPVSAMRNESKAAVSGDKNYRIISKSIITVNCTIVLILESNKMRCQCQGELLIHPLKVING